MTSAEIDELWNIADPVAGFEALTRALHRHPPAADELRTQLARALGLQGKFSEGWAELARISATPTEIVQVRVQLESGRLENSAGHRTNAKRYFLTALDRAIQDHFDFYAINAAHMLGIAAEGKESIEWNEKALALADASRDERARNWRGSLLNNLGWAYGDMGLYAEALVHFSNAVAFRSRQENAKATRIARWAVARCLRKLKRPSEAVIILNELIQHPEEGYVSEELGLVLLDLGKEHEAKPHFERADALLSQKESAEAREARMRERRQVHSEEPKL